MFDFANTSTRFRERSFPFPVYNNLFSSLQKKNIIGNKRFNEIHGKALKTYITFSLPVGSSWFGEESFYRKVYPRSKVKVCID